MANDEDPDQVARVFSSSWTRRTFGGRYGIRTHGDTSATTAFEAAPFVRSGNLPSTTLQEQGTDANRSGDSSEERDTILVDAPRTGARPLGHRALGWCFAGAGITEEGREQLSALGAPNVVDHVELVVEARV